MAIKLQEFNHFFQPQWWLRVPKSPEHLNFECRYRDKEGNWHSSSSFNTDDLLALAKLAGQAHSKILELRDGKAK